MQSYSNAPLDFCFRETGAPPRNAGKIISSIRSSSGEFSQIRPYEPGESSLRIDSKRSRFEQNQIVVREYLSEKEYFVAIVIALSPVLRYATEKYTKFDILAELTKLLVYSIQVREYTGKIYLLTSKGAQSLDIPQSDGELQDFLHTLSEELYKSIELPQESDVESCLEKAFHSIQEGGLFYFGDTIPEELLREFSSKFHIQTAAFEVLHEDEITGNEPGATEILQMRGYGAYGLCYSPKNIWLLLQNALRIW